MKINSIRVSNFIGLRSLDAKLGAVTLFAGFNWSGKTTLQQAVRLAICRDMPRVKLKKNAPLLVSELSGKAGAAVHVDTNVGNFDVKIAKGGKMEWSVGCADRETLERKLSGILDPRSFGSWDDTKRRAYLCDAFGITATPERIRGALEAAGVDAETAEKIMPLVSGGTFDAAADEAEARCKEHRAAWAAITGQTYGSEKAEGWECPPLTNNPKAAAANLERVKGLELRATMDLNEFAGKVDQARSALAMAQHQFVCKECGAVNAPDAEEASVLAARIPEFEKSLEMLENAKQNRIRDRIEAERTLKEASQAEEAQAKRTADAAEAHQAVQLWTKVKQLMSPDGIPAGLILEAQHALNNRLRKTSEVTTWPQVTLSADMTLTVGNRLYELCSEAEQWTADAAIAEALSYHTGVRLLMLDRVDVLGVERRRELLLWADELAAEDVQVVMCATLKAPVSLPGITCYWIQAGEVVGAA